MKWTLFLTLLLTVDISAQSIKLIDKDSTLFIKIPELKARKEKCLAAIDKDVSITLPTCLIDGLKDESMQPISSDLREKMIKVLEDNAKLNEQAPEFEGLEILRTRRDKDEAIKKLGEFYFKKLNDSLYGDGKKLYVEHSAFYEIFKSQVSKNLIESLSSYCIEAEQSQAFILSKNKNTRMSVRKNNIKKLEQIEGEGEEAVSTGYKEWKACMQAIQNICYKSIYTNEEIKLKINYTSFSVLNKTYQVQSADFDYSQKRACGVVNYLKVARQTILKITEIQQLINYVDGDPKKGKKDPVNWFKNLTGKEDFKSTGKTYDELTSMTSGELATSGFIEEDKKIQEKIQEECLKNSNLLACKDFLTEDVEESYKLAAEYALKLEAMMGKIEKMEPAQLKKYLKEQGYNDERIQELEKFQDELKTEIIERFRAEKEVLVTQLWNDIESKSLKVKDQDVVRSKIEKIAEELAGRGEEFTQLVHYNNIISGYLTVSGRTGDKGKVRNVQSIFRELSDSAYGEKIEGFDDLGGEERLTDIKKQLAEAGIIDPKEKREVEGLSINALNKAVLNYHVEKLDEKPLQGWDTKDQDEIATN